MSENSGYLLTSIIPLFFITRDLHTRFTLCLREKHWYSVPVVKHGCSCVPYFGQVHM